MGEKDLLQDRPASPLVMRQWNLHHFLDEIVYSAAWGSQSLITLLQQLQFVQANQFVLASVHQPAKWPLSHCGFVKQGTTNCSCFQID